MDKKKRTTYFMWGLVALVIVTFLILQSVDISKPKKQPDWQKEFITYRVRNNPDIEKLVIDGSVLYIHVKNMTSDLDTYSRHYTLQFQKAYRQNTGGNNVGTLVYYQNRLIKEIDANNNGIK